MPAALCAAGRSALDEEALLALVKVACELIVAPSVPPPAQQVGVCSRTLTALRLCMGLVCHCRQLLVHELACTVEQSAHCSRAVGAEIHKLRYSAFSTRAQSGAKEHSASNDAKTREEATHPVLRLCHAFASLHAPCARFELHADGAHACRVPRWVSPLGSNSLKPVNGGRVKAHGEMAAGPFRETIFSPQALVFLD